MRLTCYLLAGLAVLSLCATGAVGQVGEGNLLKNPGFEEPLTGSSYGGWAFVDHGQDFIRGTIEAQDYHSGLKAAGVSVGQPPRVYASWVQHVPVGTDDELPDQVSLWYRAPDNPAAVVLSFSGPEDGHTVPKGGAQIALPQSQDWRQITEKIEVPFGTRNIMFELRVNRQGEYRFDDVMLARTEIGPASGHPDRVLFVASGKLTYLWQEALEGAGWKRVSYETWDNLTPALLQQTRVVALVGLPLRPELTERDLATIEMLQDYVRAGGGLLLSQNVGQVITSMTLHFELAERFGTRILFEKTVSDPERTRRIGVWGTDYYTFTDQVRGPVAEGVRGVLYHSAVHMESLGGIMPFLPAEPWEVVLSTGPNSHSEPHLIGLEVIDRKARAEGFAEDVPLAGVRDYGQGRVAYFGMLPEIAFLRRISSDEDRHVHEAYLVSGTEEFSSDLQKLYLNTFAWLGERADALTEAQLTRREVPRPEYATEFKLFRGVIGPRTSYSTGRSTPDEYVQAARQAGMDFVVFLEDFASLDPDDFEKLKADCRRLSGADFLAVPGITYENSDGNHQYAFSEYLKLPSQLLLDETGRRFLPMRGVDGPQMDLHWLYTLLGFENHSGWYRHGDNPYPHYDARNVDSMGVLTQEGGQTVERALEEWALEARNGQFLWPLALTLMQDAGEMNLIAEGVYYHNVIGYEGMERLRSFMSSLRGRGGRHLFPGAPSFGSVFLTNGPTIQLKMPRGDTDAEQNIWNPRLQEWSFDLSVSSAVGLREVRVMDGTRMLRRFLPGGAQEFNHVTSLGRERQKAIYVHAIDMEGREAVSRDITSDSWLLRDTQCADRNNQLLYSMQARPDGTPFFISYGGDTPMPDKGPWNGRTRPVGIFVFDEVLGVGAMSYDGSPEQHPQTSFAPSVSWGSESPQSMGWTSQVVANRQGAPHVRPYRVSHSSDALIADRVLDGVFPVDARPVIHVWHTLYPVHPPTYLQTTARQYLHLVKVDGVSVYLWEQEFEFLQDIPVDPDKPFPISLGVISASTATERLLVHQGQVTDQGPVRAKPIESHPFDRGDYVGLLQSPFGSLAVYSLTDGLALSGDGVNYRVGIKVDGDTIPAGTRLRARLLQVGMHRMVEDPAALAAKVAADYGLQGEPGYQVQVLEGLVDGTDYTLSLRAGDEGCFVGRVTGVADLAGNLGAAVSGLNDHWTAFCQQQGEPARTRLVSVEQGLGYVVLRAEDEGLPLFLGHPILADNPQVVLEVARSADWQTWMLEIHNPTDHEMRVALRSNPHLRGIDWRETLTLAPGSSTIRELGPAQ